MLLAQAVIAQASEEVNVYSYRQPFLIEPMLKAFEDQTGVKVNVVFAKKGLEERIEREGKFSPADVVLTSDMISLFDSYYFGKMMQDDAQKAWADAVYINFPNQSTEGSHVNISGMVMAKYAPNKDNALKLMEYLSSEKAQSIYARDNMEYPVNPKVPVSDTVAAWGKFKADPLPISDIAANRTKAQRLLDEVKFDL